MNTKQFNTKLNGVVTSGKNLTANIQVLLEYALEQAKEHGNLTELSNLLIKTKGVRAINSAQLSKCVFAHIANVSWKSKADKRDKNIVTKFLSQDKGKKIEVTELSVVWADYEVDANAVKVVTKLANVTPETAKKKADDYRNKVRMTTDTKILQANLNLMRQQVQMLENALKSAPVIPAVRLTDAEIAEIADLESDDVQQAA